MLITKPKKSPSRLSVNEPADTIEIKKVADVTTQRSYLFYGRAGTGKTTLSSTFPGPRLLLDINDKGTDSISDTDTDVIEVQSWSKIEAIYWDMKENPERYSSYQSIIIDTVTQMQTLCIEDILKRKKKDATRAGDWGVMTKREWGDVSQTMKSWIINYRDLPKTIVFLAQDRVSKDGDEEQENEELVMPEIGPSLSPAIAKTLCAAVSVIGNTFIRRKVTVREVDGKEVRKEKIQYCLRVGPHPICLTKLRKPKSVGVPSLIVDPNYQDLLNLIKGE